MDFLQKPIRLAAHLRLVPIPDEPDSVALLSDRDARLFDGTATARVLPLLDGTRTAHDVVQALAHRHSSSDVLQAIIHLHRDGRIALADAAVDPFWEAHGVRRNGTPPGAASIRSLDGAGADALAAALAAAGVALASEPALAAAAVALASEPALDIVLIADYLDPRLAAVNAEASRPWLLARMGGSEGWLGPLVVPGQTACWECLAHRLRLHRPEHLLAGSAPHPTHPAALQAVAAACALHAARWLLQPKAPHPLRDALLTFDPAAAAMTRHPIVRRPQCPACGDPTARAPRPVELQPRPRGERDDARAGLERWGHHVDPLTGIVGELADIAGDSATPLYRAAHLARPPKSWQHLRRARRNNAGGKGTTRAQARMSALGEALERYSSWWDGTEAGRDAPYAEMAADAVHPALCMGFSADQIAHRDPAATGRAHVPEAFDEARPVGWVSAWSLTRQEWRYVAAGYALMGCPRRLHHGMLTADSNGNAAGTSLEDAIRVGFYELVERDAVALWWYNRLPRPGVDLAGVDDAYVAALRREHEALGRAFWALDLTTDLGIPACAAVSRRLGDGPDEVVMGFGAHRDGRVAVIRALTEMSQLMPARLRLAERADRTVPAAGDAKAAFNLTVADAPYLAPDPGAPARRLVAASDPADLREEIEWCRTRVEAAGMEMLVRDLTRPDIGMPVVKVMVPGMRLHWRRLGPGRLYDVPVALGWRAEPMAEGDANPVELGG